MQWCIFKESRSHPPVKVMLHDVKRCELFLCWVLNVIGFLFFSVLRLGPRQEDSPLSPGSFQVHSPYPALQTQVIFIHMEMRAKERESKRERERLDVQQKLWMRKHTYRACMNDLGCTRWQVIALWVASQSLTGAAFKCCWKYWNYKENLKSIFIHLTVNCTL